MADPLWSRISELVARALELPAGERAAFIAREADDERLREEVASLVNAAASEGDWLARLSDRIWRPRLASASSEPPMVGRRIGPWRLLELIGRGGMGTVYLAERADGAFEQQVALKLLGSPLLDSEGKRRFTAERQILARLEHPAIARLLDGGITDGGVPWFAMEYVEGVAITDYCDGNGLSLDERLALFEKVCRAVEYAHHRLIIHRDLKPSNILITANGEPRLLDFGLAKLLQKDPGGGSPFTHPEGRWMTLAYASPEQVKRASLTAASDTYQLGLILYEILTRRRPYTLKGLSSSEAKHVICEVDPPLPSAAVAAGHVSLVRKRLRGDLDAIIMKALHKDPDHGYASAETMANDLERHRKRRPIQARPETLSYRTRKFVQRHRWPVLAGVLLFLSLLGGLATTVWQAKRATENERRATENERRAVDQQEKAQEVTDFLVGLFEAGDPQVAQGDTVSARELLERGVERAEALKDRPELQATLYGVTGKVYANLGNLAQAEALYRRALEAWESMDPHPDHEVAHSRVLVGLGRVLMMRRRHDEAESFLRRAIEQRAGAGVEDDVRRDALFHLFEVLHVSNRTEAASKVFAEWNEASESISAVSDADAAERMVTMAEVLGKGGQVHGDLNEITRGLVLIDTALSTLRTTRGPRHPSVAKALRLKLKLLSYERDLRPATAEMLAQADSLTREAVALHRAIYPNPHHELRAVLYERASVLEDLERYDEAEAVLREAMGMIGDPEGRGKVTWIVCQALLAHIMVSRGDYEEAVAQYGEVQEWWAETYGEGYLFTLTKDLSLGDALTGAKRFSEAEDRLLPAYETLEAQRGRTDRFTQTGLQYLVALYDAWDKPQEAERFRRRLAERRD